MPRICDHEAVSSLSGVLGTPWRITPNPASRSQYSQPGLVGWGPEWSPVTQVQVPALPRAGSVMLGKFLPLSDSQSPPPWSEHDSESSHLPASQLGSAMGRAP